MTKTETATETTQLAAAANQLYLLSVLVKDEKSLATIKDHLKDKVTIAKEENLGLKTLAYPINKQHQLVLLSFFFMAEPQAIASIEKELTLEDEAERFLLTTWKGDINKEYRSDRRIRAKKDTE